MPEGMEGSRQRQRLKGRRRWWAGILNNKDDRDIVQAVIEGKAKENASEP